MNNIQIARGIKQLALLSVLGLTVVGLSQCRLIDDSLTGVQLDVKQGAASRAECVQTCNDKFKDAERAADARYEAEVRACGKDTACKNAAKDRDKARHAANVDAMQDCKRNCYNEGSGGGGR